MLFCVHRVVLNSIHHLLMSLKTFRDMLIGLKFMTMKGIVVQCKHYHYLIVVCRLMGLAVNRLKQIFSLSFYKCDGPVENGQMFPQILIVSSCYYFQLEKLILPLQDLSKYNNDELLHESLHLLGRFHSAEENLFEKAVQTQVYVCILLMLIAYICPCMYSY